MAKVLWIAEPGTLPSQQHIIDHLKSQGHILTVEDSPDYLRFKNAEYFKKHNDAKYHFAIYTIHTGNPNATEFVKKLSCQRKFIICHDVFGDKLDGSTPSWNTVETIVFTKKQEQEVKANGIKNPTQTRWYKLDMPVGDIPFDKSYRRNAVIIDSTLFRRDFVFPYKKLFDKVYLKRWSQYEPIFENNRLKSLIPSDNLCLYGADEAPLTMYGMAGMHYAHKAGAIWFVRESSMYTEALMMGNIPILYEHPKFEFPGVPYIVKESPLTDIVSDVIVNIRVNDNSYVPYGMRGITVSNIEKKVRALQTSDVAYQESLALLSKEWLFDTPAAHLPTVEDILSKYIH